MRVWAFSFLLFLFSFDAFAQTDPAFDAAFASLKDGNSKIDSLNKLCSAIDDNEIAIACERKVKALAEKLNYQKGLAQALNNLGVSFKHLEKGNEALEYHLKALDIRLWIGDKKDISASYNNIGNTYDLIGDKKSAVDNHMRALKLREELKDTLAMARSLNNIASAYLDVPDYYRAAEYGFKAVKLYEAKHDSSGNYADVLNNVGNAYSRLKDFDKAMVYFRKALAIQEALGDKQEIAKLLDNIAIIFHQQGQQISSNMIKAARFSAALKNYTKALDILSGTDENELSALIHNNIGNTYWELNNFSKALTELNKALDIYKKLDNKSGIAGALNSLGVHYKLQKKYDQSIKFAVDALAIADKIDDIEQKKNSCEVLSYDYRELKQFEKSLFYYTRYTEEKDKLINVEGAKKLVQKEASLEYSKKEQEIKLAQERERIIAEEKSQRQKFIIWGVGVGLVLVILFAGFVFNRWRITQKQKQIIEEQKHEVDEQKKLVEEKNKDITDSINYAQRIQQAMLPHQKDIIRAFPESFVFFRPKDIVSGDFYWAINSDTDPAQSKFFIGCCDCTGHGVPGAFMSLLNISFLNQAVKEKSITEPQLILNSVREGIMNALNPDGTSDAKDGMDAVLCVIDKQSNMLHTACANNPIWYVQNGAMLEIKPDKMPVGNHTNMGQSFTKNSIQLNSGDTIYLFTDGYADQFGGPKNKKFRYKQLQEVLLKNNHLPMKQQMNELERIFLDWKGTCEQVDDVLVIGIRI